MFLRFLRYPDPPAVLWPSSCRHLVVILLFLACYNNNNLFVNAASYLETSGANSCQGAENSVVNVTDFSIFYTRDSTQVSYSVKAHVSEKIDDVLVRIQVSAYGDTIVDQLLDLCTDNITELCPVKSGYISVSGSHNVPLSYMNSINQLAYSIPDLDGSVYVQIYNASNVTQNLGCFSSDVTNGKSIQSHGATYATLGIAAAMVVIAAASSASSSSGSSAGGGAGAVGAGHAAYTAFQAPGFGDFFSVLQGIAVSGMYSLYYPTVYRSFTQNMGWSAGMITWAGLQTSIDTFRRHTGGNLTEISYPILQDTSLVYENSTLDNADQLIPSGLLASLVTPTPSSTLVSSSTSTGTTPTTGTITSTIYVDERGLAAQMTSTLGIAWSKATGSLSSPSQIADVLLKLQGKDGSSSSSDSSSDSSDSSNKVEVVTGIKAYVEKLNIPNTNAFLTLLIWWCIVLGFIVIFMMILKLALDIRYHRDMKKYGVYKGPLNGYRVWFFTFLLTMVLRVIIIFYGIWVCYSLYQFKIGDAWGTRLLAGLSFAIFTLILLLLSARVVILSREAQKREGGLENLYAHEPWLRKYGVLYDQFKISYWWFFIPILVATFTRNAFLALGYGNGLVQVVGQLVVEVILTGSMIGLQPFNTRWGNWINIGIQVIRVISLCLLMTYTKQANVSGITSTGIGFALIAIQSALAILMILLILIGIGLSIRQFIKNNMKQSGNTNNSDNGRNGEPAPAYDTEEYNYDNDETRALTGGYTAVEEKKQLGKAFEENPHRRSNKRNGGSRSPSGDEIDGSDGSDLIKVFSAASHDPEEDFNNMPKQTVDHSRFASSGAHGNTGSNDSSNNSRLLEPPNSDVIRVVDSDGRESFESVDKLRGLGLAHPETPNSVYNVMRRAPSRNSVILLNEHAHDEPQSVSYVHDIPAATKATPRLSHYSSPGGGMHIIPNQDGTSYVAGSSGDSSSPASSSFGSRSPHRGRRGPPRTPKQQPDKGSPHNYPGSFF